MKRFVTLILTIISLFIFPASAGLGIKGGTHLDSDGGQAVMLFGELPIDYQSIGWYVLRTYKGSDSGNVIVGMDYGFKPFASPMKLSIGPAYAQDPLRVVGQRLNLHLSVGFDVGRHLIFAFEHWSNCRRACNHNADTTRNLPRNMLTAGVKF